MSFREKSAWAMGALMLATGIVYLRMILSWAAADDGAPAPLAGFVGYVVLVVCGSIVIQVVLSALWRREAGRPADERERLVIDRAGHWGGAMLAVGVVIGAIAYLGHGEGVLLFHIAMGSLIVSQIAEYAFQIFLFRRGV